MAWEMTLIRDSGKYRSSHTARSPRFYEVFEEVTSAVMSARRSEAVIEALVLHDTVELFLSSAVEVLEELAKNFGDEDDDIVKEKRIAIRHLSAAINEINNLRPLEDFDE